MDDNPAGVDRDETVRGSKDGDAEGQASASRRALQVVHDVRRTAEAFAPNTSAFARVRIPSPNLTVAPGYVRPGMVSNISPVFTPRSLSLTRFFVHLTVFDAPRGCAVLGQMEAPGARSR